MRRIRPSRRQREPAIEGFEPQVADYRLNGSNDGSISANVRAGDVEGVGGGAPAAGATNKQKVWCGLYENEVK